MDLGTLEEQREPLRQGGLEREKDREREVREVRGGDERADERSVGEGARPSAE